MPASAAAELSRPSPLTDPLDQLAARSTRLAGIVEAISRRRDVRQLRARLLLLVVELACPLGSNPRRAWYVPGAVARLGASGLRRSWARRFGGEAPSERTLRTHLATLEASLAIVREPGRHLPRLWSAEAPERRPRWPDTLHLVLSEDEASWWADEGRRILEQHPSVRRCPRAWRELVGDWRARARGAAAEGVQLALPFGEPRLEVGGRRELDPPARRRLLEQGRALAEAALEGGGAFELASALRGAGVELRGKLQWSLLARPGRLRGAMALLAVALLRGDRVRSPAGWLVRAARAAPETEGAEALSQLARGGRLGRSLEG